MKKHIKGSFTLSMLITGVVSFVGSAYANEAKTVKLDDIVSTGSLLATPISKVPGNVSIVTAQEMKKTDNQKVADYVRRLEGVHVNNDAGFNPRPSIRIRGINYGTLIMLDGVILSDLEGENRILNQISLYDVERVEVARGAFSSLYGTSAIGGVINFITSMPDKLTTQVIVGYGNEFKDRSADLNLMRAYFELGNAFFDKRLKVKISGGLTTTEGYPSVPAFTTGTPNEVHGYFVDKSGQTIAGDAGRREYRTFDVRVKANYDSDNYSIKSMFSISSHDYTFVDPLTFLRDSSGLPVFTGKFGPQTNGGTTINPFIGTGYEGHGRYTHYIASLSYTYFWDNASLKVALSSVNLDSYWLDPATQDATKVSFGGGPGYSQDIYTSSNYLDILYDYKINDAHSITVALQGRYLNYDQLNFTASNWKVRKYNGNPQAYGGMALVGSAYVDWNASWSDTLSSTLGFRYDYWQDFANYLKGPIAGKTNIDLSPKATNIPSPKASINYKPFDFLSFKAALGLGYRMPTIREKYRISFGQFWNVNPNLKPEVGVSGEIGAELNTQYIAFKAYYYQTELTNMIYRQGNGKEATPYEQKNAGYGRINGVELATTVPIYDSLSFYANYTLTLARIISNPANPKTIGKQLPSTPEHMANFGLTYGKAKGAYGSIEGSYASAAYADAINSPINFGTFGQYDPQFRLNLKLGYVFKSGIDISGSILNATNNRYYDYYQVAGISYYLQARYKI
ncbi:hypothetical protein BKH43_01875 [Helicobacter sp. 13S00401-1]|uniref:TonB-dependent receptor n=1 Tax=Helicobacter sp. 13S00401-1 TaxID=1905758 RepID=UPI000BA5468C|nr:TonB-dependent receptor [Helicobacter sp. 13S00401-1]PAF51413.1 hypothetical protein BKH43_01875 [Helicobacter sp. 13S00401-1]